MEEFEMSFLDHFFYIFFGCQYFFYQTVDSITFMCLFITDFSTDLL